MPSYTIYSDADDHGVIGGGFSNFYNSSSTATAAGIGRAASFGGLGYQYLPKFDTSAVSGTFQSGTLNFVTTANGTYASTQTVKMRDHTWSTPSTGNYVAGGSLSALTLRASGSVANGAGNRSIALSSIVVSSAWAAIVHSEPHETNTGDGYFEILTSEFTGTTNDPYLSITTVTTTNHPGAGAFSGAGTFSGAGRIVKSGSAAFSGTGSFTAIATFSLGGRASFSGAGTFAGSGRLAAQGSASFAGTGTFVGNGNAALSGAALFAGAGTFTAASALAMQGSGSFAATSRFIATPKLKILQRSLGRYPSYARSVRTSQVRWRGGLPTRN